jgi:hypothetical protein
VTAMSKREPEPAERPERPRFRVLAPNRSTSRRIRRLIVRDIEALSRQTWTREHARFTGHLTQINASLVHAQAGIWSDTWSTTLPATVWLGFYPPMPPRTLQIGENCLTMRAETLIEQTSSDLGGVERREHLDPTEREKP